jgi:monoamine oxidase
MDRRRMLQLAAGAAAAGAGGCVTSGRGSDQSVAVVGAGIAGLTAAYRLSKAGQTVHLYDAQQRPGGRIHTRDGFNRDGMFVELGAELIDTNHRDLIRLARELGVGLQDLREGETGKDYFWFDRAVRTEKDLLTVFRPLGDRIAADAEGLYDRRDNFTAKARALDQVSLADYLRKNGSVVPGWVTALLIAAYEPELGVEASRQSCLNLVDFINPDTSGGFEVFGDSDEAWRIRGGNSRLIEAVAAALNDRVERRFGQPLRGVSQEGGEMLLRFGSGSGGRVEKYGRVVFALPFSILREVGGVFDLPMSAAKKRAIREMGYGMNVKVFRGFKSRVWRDSSGRPAGAPPSNGSVFAEEPTFQNVWETSVGQSGASGIITNLLGGRRGRNYSNAAMRRHLDELDAVFPGAKAAHDGNAAAMDWPRMPWAKGSYSCPLTGQYTWIYEAAAAPELDGRLVFAGEHTSLESPGFMNGGVESGNRAAREILLGA